MLKQLPLCLRSVFLCGGQRHRGKMPLGEPQAQQRLSVQTPSDSDGGPVPPVHTHGPDGTSGSPGELAGLSCMKSSLRRFVS